MQLSQQLFIEKLSQAETDEAVIEQLNQFTLNRPTEDLVTFFNSLIIDSDLAQKTKNLIEQYVFLIRDYYPNLPFIKGLISFIKINTEKNEFDFDIDEFKSLLGSNLDTIRSYFKDHSKLNQNIEKMIDQRKGAYVEQECTKYLNFIFKLYGQAINVLLAERRLMEKQQNESGYIDLTIKEAVFESRAQTDGEETFRQLKIMIKEAIQNLFSFIIDMDNDYLTLKYLLEIFNEKIYYSFENYNFYGINYSCSVIIKEQFPFLKTDPFETLTDKIKVARKVLKTILDICDLDCVKLPV